MDLEILYRGMGRGPVEFFLHITILFHQCNNKKISEVLLLKLYILHIVYIVFSLLVKS